MQITNENIGSLEVGQKVFRANTGFKIPDNLTYVGKHKIAFNLNYHCFINTNTSIVICDVPYAISGIEHYLFTTYEESCEKMRELSLAKIEHYNNHQFKNNKIIVNDKNK